VWEGLEEGVALISRHPILEHSTYNFTRKEADRDKTFRSALHCLLDIPLAGDRYLSLHPLSTLSFSCLDPSRPQVKCTSLPFIFRTSGSSSAGWPPSCGGLSRKKSPQKGG
jgi:hypothetical protein